MAYNFKKIKELELINEVPEGANVLIETDGATKRLPSTSIKPAPIQSDFAQNDPTAPDYVKNRTHYEETTVVNEPLNITWDGNTEGLVSVDDFFYKVSNLVLTDEQIKSAQISAIGGDEPFIIAYAWDSAVENGEVTDDVVSFLDSIVFVRKAGVEIWDIVFPECGIYFGKEDEGFYITSLTTTEPVEQTNTVVHKLDGKYLPEGLPYKSIETVNEPLNITWDGNTEGLVSVDDYYYKVSGDVFTDEQIKLMTSTLYNGGRDITLDIGDAWDALVNVGGVTEDFVVLSLDWMGVIVRKAGADADGIIFQETGVYLAKEEDDYYMSSLTTTEPIEQVKTVVHKLDKKFLPDDVVSGGVRLYFSANDYEEGLLPEGYVYDVVLYKDANCVVQYSPSELRSLRGQYITLVNVDDPTLEYIPVSYVLSDECQPIFMFLDIHKYGEIRRHLLYIYDEEYGPR